MGISTVQICYEDGVSSPSQVCQTAVSLTQEDGSAFTTTAKHLGDGSSPSNYYQTGGGSVIGDSPQNWNALIPATGSGDQYTKMTLVFCVYPVTLGDTNAWYIFGAESGHLIVGNWDLAGGIWIDARTLSDTASYNTVPSGSPSDYGGMVPGQWNSIMIAYDGDATASPQTRNVKIWSNGSEIYDGAWDAVSPNDASHEPHAKAGYCWAGRGDGFTGATDDGMDCYLSYIWCKEEYLDPATYWSSFFDGSNKPLNIGADGSTVTGSAPETFAPDGDLSNNLGTGASWDEIGTVPAAPSSPTD